MERVEMKIGPGTACVKSACLDLEVEKWCAAALVAQESGSNLKDILLLEASRASSLGHILIESSMKENTSWQRYQMTSI